MIHCKNELPFFQAHDLPKLITKRPKQILLSYFMLQVRRKRINKSANIDIPYTCPVCVCVCVCVCVYIYTHEQAARQNTNTTQFSHVSDDLYEISRFSIHFACWAEEWQSKGVPCTVCIIFVCKTYGRNYKTYYAILNLWLNLNENKL